MDSNSQANFPKFLRFSFVVVLISVIFALSYTQSPQFTSNQNQYFLHGLADAGFGYLDQDWLANTADPTPVFSILVNFSHQNIGNTIFYFYYSILLAIYLFSILGIVSSIYEVIQSRTTFLIYLASFILVNSAVIRFIFSRTLGENWTYILEDGIADQRLLGTVFQPSTFGVLLVLSIYLFIRKKPYLAVFFAALSAIIHPTYLLSAGLLTFTYLVIIYIEDRQIKRCLQVGSFALFIVAPILTFVIVNFGNTPAETTARARELLVNFRIPHHALYSWWLDATVFFKLGIMILALYLIRGTKLFIVLFLPFLITLLLSLIQIISGNEALALMFPWRLTTFLLPISTSLILAHLIIYLRDGYPDKFSRNSHILELLSLLLIALVAIGGIIRLSIDFERKSNIEERSMMDYVYTNSKSGDIYLTPIKLQDFRLATGMPVFVDFKSIPYKDSDVLEWYRRIILANRFYRENECQLVTHLKENENISHIVISNENRSIDCPNMERIYQDEYYSIFILLNP